MDTKTFYHRLDVLFKDPVVKNNPYWNCLVLKCAKILTNHSFDETYYGESIQLFSQGVSRYYIKRNKVISDNIAQLFHDIQPDVDKLDTSEADKAFNKKWLMRNLAYGLIMEAARNGGNSSNTNIH
ncbi:hypothetical protein CBF37_11075 [Vagococcus vulneris]|uniref:Uncharacterized protein n=2 Tax=Vagococcus vulneris TaxID=1977869 RepID=A0A429ZSB4_9ENTE|nr:hypothetical protein CBF37_11075 [Vagococcus vulneris]